MPPDQLDVYKIDILRHVDGLVKMLTKMNHKGWANDVRNYIQRTRFDKMRCPIQSTVKTHKEIGKIVFRVIHSAPNRFLR